MDILKFVDLAVFAHTWLGGGATRAHSHAGIALTSGCKVILLHLPDEISIGREVELLLSIVVDGGHSTLTDAFCSLLLSLCDLLLHASRIIMFDFLESIEK